ncbi:MAG: hypothetical protein KTR16_02895 [Acidiferrobacterales bacterium]|nr:hypothetical protein [Acidiferrobacterales bacterium]
MKRWRLVFGADRSTRQGILLGLFCCIVCPLFLVYTLWFPVGAKVDEAEIVLFAIGFFGGDLDPVWDGYGHLNMYLLGAGIAIYAFIGSVVYEQTFNQFVLEKLFSEQIYAIARYFFTIAAVAGILVASNILSHLRARRTTTAIFVIAAVLSPLMQTYANYVRSDTLVAVFTALLLLSLFKANNVYGLLKASAYCAAAIACKISALSLSGLIFLGAMDLILRKKVAVTHAVFCGIALLCLVFVFSPHMDYYALIRQVIDVEYTSTTTNLLRLEYAGFFAKIVRIGELHTQALGTVGFSLALVSIFWLRRDPHRRLLALLWATLILTVVPYLFGTTLRDYWFLSSYLITAVLAFFTLDRLFKIACQRVSKQIYSAAMIGVLVSVSVFPAKHLLDRYSSLHKDNLVTNKSDAKAWLSSNLVDPSILIDLNFSYVYPAIYDLNNLANARVFSGLFSYERHNNIYLSSLFEMYLRDIQDSHTHQNNSSSISMSELRVDIEGRPSRLSKPKVCSIYSERCFYPVLKSSNDVRIISQNDNVISLEAVGPDAYLVFQINRVLPLDGSMVLHMENDAKRWQTFYRLNQKGTSPWLVESPFYENTPSIPIQVVDLKPVVNWFMPGAYAYEQVRNPENAVFVTSQWAMKRFERILTSSISGSPKALNAKTYVDWYQLFVDDDLLYSASKGSGKRVDIYRIPLVLASPEAASE